MITFLTIILAISGGVLFFSNQVVGAVVLVAAYFVAKQGSPGATDNLVAFVFTVAAISIGLALFA